MTRKIMDSLHIGSHTLINIPATPLGLVANAHFGRVFLFARKPAGDWGRMKGKKN